MRNTKNRVSNKAQSKGLLIAVFLFSLFSFSAYPAYQSHRLITKTESIVSFRQVPERANFFKTFFSSACHKNSITPSSIDIKATLLQFAQQDKLKFDSNFRQVLCFKSVTRFYRQLHSPYCSDEDSLIFPRG